MNIDYTLLNTLNDSESTTAVLEELATAIEDFQNAKAALAEAQEKAQQEAFKTVGDQIEDQHLDAALAALSLGDVQEAAEITKEYLV